MRSSKFFKFTIYGDDFAPKEAKSQINLPAKIFIKNEVIKKDYLDKKYLLKQKTNRWGFTNDLIDSTSVSKFLTDNLLIIIKHLNEIRPFIKNNKAKIEYTIYAENHTDLRLSKKQIEMLNKISVPFYISFC